MKQRITGHGYAAIVICLGTFGAALTGSFWLVNRLAYVMLLTLVLSYDHGLMDGYEAATALTAAKTALENLEVR